MPPKSGQNQMNHGEKLIGIKRMLIAIGIMKFWAYAFQVGVMRGPRIILVINRSDAY